MWRVVLLIAAALVVADTTGLLPEADSTECADGDCGKQCPPSCPTCTCAWHSLKTSPALVIELRGIELISRTSEIPPPAAAHGRLAPPPTTRPPIV